MPWLASKVLLFVTERVEYAAEAKSGRRPIRRALILNNTKAGVGEDVGSIFQGTRDYELIAWPSYVLWAFAKALLAPGLDHNNYVSTDPVIEQSKAHYREFLRSTWEHFRAATPVDLVIAGNYAYVQQREFGAALEDAGTPFIVIHKENVRPPRRVKNYWYHLYKDRRGPFVGSRIIVYNEIERDLQISSGVFDADRITVTGMPRLDRIHRWRREGARYQPAANRLQILFLSFSPQSKLTAPGRKRTATAPKGRYQIGGEWGNLSWQKLWAETHKAAIRLAKAHPDLRVIIKVKGTLNKDADLNQLLRTESLPANLEVTGGGDPFALIISSQVVVGFNTTGLLEAIAAGKPVVVPRFFESADPARHDLIIDLGEAVRYASSPDDLIRLVLECASKPQGSSDLSEEVCRALRYWVGNDDGRAGRRALEAVEDVLTARAAWDTSPKFSKGS